MATVATKLHINNAHSNKITTNYQQNNYTSSTCKPVEDTLESEVLWELSVKTIKSG